VVRREWLAKVVRSSDAAVRAVTKGDVCSGGMGWSGRWSWKELGEEDAGEDERGSCERAMAETLVEEDEGDEPGEDGFEGEEERGVGGRKMLLGPALNGEGSGRSEEAGDS